MLLTHRLLSKADEHVLSVFHVEQELIFYIDGLFLFGSREGSLDEFIRQFFGTQIGGEDLEVLLKYC
jgi:hypothetical protein